MAEGFFSRGFLGRRRHTGGDDHLPPGQYLEDGFPVLSAGPTPRTPLELSDIERTERELLDEEVGQVQAAGGTVAQAHLRMGEAAPEIVALGEEIGAG